MIEAKNGELKIWGSGGEIISEFSLIAGALKDNGIPDSLITLAVSIGLNEGAEFVRRNSMIDELMKEVKKSANKK